MRTQLDEAEKRAQAAEARLAEMEKRLEELSCGVEEATDRSQRALRVPTGLMNAFSRGQQGGG